MVLEQIFRPRWVEKRPQSSFLLGVLFSLAGFISASAIFANAPGMIPVSAVFFTVILSVPGVNKLLDLEERTEAQGKKSFLKEHEAVIDLFVYFFLGIFCVFFVLSLVVPSRIFSEAQLYGSPVAESRPAGVPPPPGSSSAWSIIQNNLFVMAASFLLSFFYSSGALFLIVLNASVFASGFARSISQGIPKGVLPFIGYVACALGTRFLHTIPEVVSYILVAIAGGVLSKAFIREKWFSARFYAVVKDAVLLFVIASVLVVAIGVAEVHVTLPLIVSNVCASTGALVGTLIFFGALVAFELWRKEKAIFKKSSIKKTKK